MAPSSSTSRASAEIAAVTAGSALSCTANVARCWRFALQFGWRRRASCATQASGEIAPLPVSFRETRVSVRHVPASYPTFAEGLARRLQVADQPWTSVSGSLEGSSSLNSNTVGPRRANADAPHATPRPAGSSVRGRGTRAHAPQGVPRRSSLRRLLVAEPALLTASRVASARPAAPFGARAPSRGLSLRSILLLDLSDAITRHLQGTTLRQ